MGKIKKTKVSLINGSTVVIGDSSNMKLIKDNSVNLIITSPPYWKLKDY